MISLLDRLPSVTSEQRSALLAAPRTAEAHRALMADVMAMNAVQLGGQTTRTALPAEITVAAWNVERCLFPADTAAHLGALAPDVVLLSEVDHGMARTGQRHTTAEMAEALGMVYAFGVEFHELDLGGATERAYCTDDFNALGWHGNAILLRGVEAAPRIQQIDLIGMKPAFHQKDFCQSHRMNFIKRMKTPTKKEQIEAKKNAVVNKELTEEQQKKFDKIQKKRNTRNGGQRPPR